MLGPSWRTVPKKLSKTHKSVHVQIVFPADLKGQMVEMAEKLGDGDVSSWVRGLVREQWKNYQKDSQDKRRPKSALQ